MEKYLRTNIGFWSLHLKIESKQTGAGWRSRVRGCGLNSVWLGLLCLVVAYDGRTDELSQEGTAWRIISLGPSITKQLYLLGVEDRLVGITTYCPMPQGRRIEKIGSVVAVNVEKIVMLKPGLVLATTLTDRRQVEKLKELRLRVVAFGQPKDFFEICKQFVELGKLIGRQERAKEVVRNAKVRVDRVAERVRKLQRPRAFIQVGTKPLFTANKDSFLNDIIKLAGGINIAEDAESGIYSREKVLGKNPDCIIIATMGVAGENEKKAWQQFKTLKAAQDKRLHIINADELCSPTPDSFVEALEEIVGILHP